MAGSTVWRPSEVTGGSPDGRQQISQLGAVLLIEGSERELSADDRVRGLGEDGPALGSDRGQHGPAVLRVRGAFDQLSSLQPLHQRRDRGGVDLQPLADLAKRQRSAAREGEQDQDLITRESETQGPQELV